MWRLLFVVALVAIPRAARAQIVNVQGALAKTPPGDGEAGQLEAKLNWRTGNNPIIDVGGAPAAYSCAAFRARAGRGAWRVRLWPRPHADREVVRAPAHPDILDRRWRWEAFVQHEFDRFRRLSLRTLAGTGPALQLVDQGGAVVTAGAAYLIEYERPTIATARATPASTTSIIAGRSTRPRTRPSLPT